MIAKKLTVTDFRNIKKAAVRFDDKLNIMYGHNGSGKTNLAEALYFFALAKSFRVHQDKNTVSFGAERAELHLQYKNSVRSCEAHISLTAEGDKEITDNSISIAPSSFVGKYRAVLYNPDMLELIKDGPAERRRFLDVAICQIDPKYMDSLKRCNFAYKERSKTLSAFHAARQAAGGYLPDGGYREYMRLIRSYDTMIAEHGGYLMLARRDYIRGLELHFLNFVHLIYGEDFSVSLRYKPSLLEGMIGDGKEEREWQEALHASISSSFDHDISKGGLSFGPARDDIEIRYLSMPAKESASQGQQRILVIALKYAEGMMSLEKTKEEPTFILDDIMSELDRATQIKVTSIFSKYQTVITTADVGYVDDVMKSSDELGGFLTPKIFKVSLGEVFG